MPHLSENVQIQVVSYKVAESIQLQSLYLWVNQAKNVAENIFILSVFIENVKS